MANGHVQIMKNLLLDQFLGSLFTPAPRPVEEVRDRSIQAMMAETRRELAMFASDLMGTQSFIGQFGSRGSSSGTINQGLFRELVEDAPMPCLMVDPRPGLRIVDINDAYAAATLTVRGKVAGEKMFDVFPDNPEIPDADGVSNLFESLQKAAQSGKPHTMAIQRYDVRDAGGNFVVRHWLPVNTPIFDETGNLVYLLHQVREVPG